MTNMKNFIPRRKYRERGQLRRREHLGLLQKKKDYKIRAEDYKKKQQALKQLSLKASLKNPDEFYFKMVRSKKQGGKVIQLQDGDSDLDEAQYRKVLKTQNLGLVKMQQAMARSAKDKLMEQLHLVNQKKNNSIQIFVDTKEQFDNFDLAKHYDTFPELLQFKGNVLRKGQIQQQVFSQDQQDAGKLKQNHHKLLLALEKADKMDRLFKKLDYQKNLLNKERRRRIQVKQEGVKRHRFFRERKK